MTSIFIIAGFRLDHTASTIPEFMSLLSKLKELDFNIVPVDISYKNKDITTYVNGFIEKYSKHKTERNIILGNSYGAAVTLISAKRFMPDEVILCSMSPFFKETLIDPKWFEYSLRKFGQRRTVDLIKYSSETLLNELNEANIKVSFLYGEKEKKKYPQLVTFNKNLARLSNNKIEELKGVLHSFKDTDYQNALINYVKSNTL